MNDLIRYEKQVRLCIKKECCCFPKVSVPDIPRPLMRWPSGYVHSILPYQTRVIELGKFLNPVIGPLIVSAYRRTVTKQPKLVGMLTADNIKLVEPVHAARASSAIYTHTSQVIPQLKPDLSCARIRSERGRLPAEAAGSQRPRYTLITDYDAHGTWTSSEVNKYLVSTADVKKKLTDRGVSASRIEVTGIPGASRTSGRRSTGRDLQAQFNLNRFRRC